MNGPKFISEAEYAALPGLRASWAKTLWQSTPAHLRARMDESLDSDAFRFGRALHCALLRPQDFGCEFVVSPKFDRRTKQGKEDAARFEAEHAGAAMIDQDEADGVELVRRGVLSNPTAAALLNLASIREATYLGEIAGYPCKCRVDAVGGGILLDVKTCASAAPRAFSRACADFGYHLQFAFYREILRQNSVPITDVVLVAAEKAAPYAVALYRMREGDLDAMLPVVERAAALFRYCVENDRWDAYGDSVQEIAMPEWSLNGGNTQ